MNERNVMSERNDPRVHFGGAFSDLIDELRSENIFENLAQIAMFCATLGFEKRTTSSRTRSKYDVRYSLLRSVRGGETLINAIALANAEFPVTTDPLGAENLDNRLKAFEEFCNGGLLVIKNKHVAGVNLHQVIADISNEYMRSKEQ